jgi:hypothetical protein
MPLCFMAFSATVRFLFIILYEAKPYKFRSGFCTSMIEMIYFSTEVCRVRHAACLVNALNKESRVYTKTRVEL